MLCNCFACSACGGFEGSLPNHCPGVHISTIDQDLICNGTLDYDGQRWIKRERREWEKEDPAKDAEVEAAIIRLNWEQASRQLGQLFQEAPNIRKRSD
jgi:hypothetical protein